MCKCVKTGIKRDNVGIVPYGGGMERSVKSCSMRYCRRKFSYICCTSCDCENCADRCSCEAGECRYCSQRLNEVGILCPFFVGELMNRSEKERKQLRCEGLVTGTVEKILFLSGRKRDLFMCEFCCADWEKCPRAQEIKKKYKEDEQK